LQLIWLDTADYIPDTVNESQMLNSLNQSSNTSEIRVLIAKACKSQLTPVQQQELENALTKDSSLLLQLELTPSKVTECLSFTNQIT
jgi:hypothetical protein